MKKIKHSIIIAVCAAASLLLPLQASAQLGGLAKAAGGGGDLTEDSMNADIFGGFEFFAKAYGYFGEALGIADKLAEDNAEMVAGTKGKDKAAAQKAAKKMKDKVEARVKEKINEGNPLTDKENELIKLGKEEAGKGVVKWAALGVSLAMAAKSGKADATVAAALPAAKELVKDLPAIKDMLKTMNELSKLNKKAKKTKK